MTESRSRITAAYPPGGPTCGFTRHSGTAESIALAGDRGSPPVKGCSRRLLWCRQALSERINAETPSRTTIDRTQLRARAHADLGIAHRECAVHQPESTR